MYKKKKKNDFFLCKHWIFQYLCAILTTLFAQNCLLVYGDEVHRKIPKPAWQLEKELAETEKKLASVTNEKEQLEAELKILKKENSIVRKELIETLDKYSMLTGKLKRWEMSVAAVMETLVPDYVDAREEDTVESLRTVMQSSVALASAANELCEEVNKLIDLPGIESVRAAKLRVMINGLKGNIREIVHLHAVPTAPQGFASCRVLKIDSRLQAAVFSAGYRDGLRTGMILRTPDGKVQFKVVLLRNFTAAGILSEGDLKLVDIGTKVVAIRGKTAK